MASFSTRIALAGTAALGLFVQTPVVAQDTQPKPQPPVTIVRPAPPVLAVEAPPPRKSDDAWIDGMMRTDFSAIDIPQDQRDDLSDCGGTDSAGVIRASQQCWPVLQVFRMMNRMTDAGVAFGRLSPDQRAKDTPQSAALTEMADKVIAATRDRAYPANDVPLAIAYMARQLVYEERGQYNLAIEELDKARFVMRTSDITDPGYRNPSFAETERETLMRKMRAAGQTLAPRPKPPTPATNGIPPPLGAPTPLPRPQTRITPPPAPQQTPPMSVVEAQIIYKPLGRTVSDIEIAPADRADTSSCGGTTFIAIAAALDTCWPELESYQKLIPILERFKAYGTRKRISGKIEPQEARDMIAEIDVMVAAYDGREYPAYDWTLNSLYFARAFLYGDLGDEAAAMAELDKIQDMADSTRLVDLNDGRALNLGPFRAAIRSTVAKVNGE